MRLKKSWHAGIILVAILVTAYWIIWYFDLAPEIPTNPWAQVRAAHNARTRTLHNLGVREIRTFEGVLSDDDEFGLDSDDDDSLRHKFMEDP